jgi:hypothetical protein
MPSTKDVTLGGRLMCLFIGESGTGKTCAAASFPLPMKIYDFDGRMKPIKLMYPDKDIEYDTFGPKNMQAFIDEFNGLYDRCKYKTVVIDSLTSLSVTLINFQLRFRDTKGAKKVGGGITVTGWDEINGETVTVCQILDICKMLPCNVVLTAHPVARTEIIDGISKRSRQLVAYGPKIGSMVPGYFDEVYHFTVEPPINLKERAKHIIVTQNIGEELAKSALPIPVSIDITNKPLYDLIQGYVSEQGVTLEGGSTEVKSKNKLVAF